MAKLSPQYIDPLEIPEGVDLVAYRIALPLGLSGFHMVFHISMLKINHRNRDYIIKLDKILLDKNWFMKKNR